MIGRFASADTIIPNAFDPASFDRYAYVRNSPVNFIDPSGHNAVDCSYLVQAGAPASAVQACDANTGPETVDTTTLTDAAKLAYGTYKQLFNVCAAGTPAWWCTNPYLGGDGLFTIDDYVTIILYLELAGLYNDPAWVGAWTQALARHQRDWAGAHPGITTVLSTSEGQLNWITSQTNMGGTFRQDISAFEDHGDPTKSPGASLSGALPVVTNAWDAIQNPSSVEFQGELHPDWERGCYNSNFPCYVGSNNKSGGTLSYIEAFIDGGCKAYMFRGKPGSCVDGGKFAFILTSDQANTLVLNK